MDKKTIEEQTLLALFEGAIKEDHCHYMIPDLNRIVWVEKMLYASDWNWIMRIVDKIESLIDVDEFNIQCDNTYKTQTCTIYRSFKDGFDTIIETGKSKIEAVYKACLQFIEWYNANLKEDGSN